MCCGMLCCAMLCHAVAIWYHAVLQHESMLSQNRQMAGTAQAPFHHMLICKARQVVDSCPLVQLPFCLCTVCVSCLKPTMGVCKWQQRRMGRSIRSALLVCCLEAISQRQIWLISCLCVMSEASHGCVQLTAEGGWDAAQEAPFLYAAMDALAARAGTWAERRQRLRIEAASEQAASTMAEPVVMSREAIAFVKQVWGW